MSDSPAFSLKIKVSQGGRVFVGGVRHTLDGHSRFFIGLADLREPRRVNLRCLGEGEGPLQGWMLCHWDLLKRLHRSLYAEDAGSVLSILNK